MIKTETVEGQTFRDKMKKKQMQNTMIV